MPDYPVIERTWEQVELALAAQGSQLATEQNLVYQIVQALTNAGSFTTPWQIRGSSNSVTASLLALGAAGPGTGWAAPASLVWAGGAAPHSWIVLRKTTWGGASAGAHPEILISCNYGISDYLYVWFSPNAGFTGGSTTLDPTATDAVPLFLGGTQYLTFGANGTNQAYTVDVFQTNDSADALGACTRVVIRWGTIASGFWSFETPKQPVTGWTYPVTSMILGTNTGVTPLVHGNLYQNISPTYGLSPLPVNGKTPLQFFWTGESIGTGLLTTLLGAPNDLSGKYPMMPCGLNVPASGSGASPSSAGRLGMFFDIWWGVSTLPYAQQYAGAAPHAFTQFGELIFPWPSGASTGVGDVNGYTTGLLADLGFVLPTQIKPYAVRLGPAQTYYYQMEGTDAVTTATASWVVQGAPDFAAQFYTGGLTLPLRDECVIAEWPAPQ